ncbi:MAG: hypothetical protein OHK0018_13360 [Erythrobacter tepidarius]
MGEAGHPVEPHPDIEAVDANIDPLNQQLDNARLLGREQFIPERIEGGCPPSAPMAQIAA